MASVERGSRCGHIASCMSVMTNRSWEGASRATYDRPPFASLDASGRFIVHRRLLAIALLTATAAASAGPRIYPTGVTLYDPAKAWNGYVIFAAPDERTHLIDM